jgi:hypothetical protein
MRVQMSKQALSLIYALREDSTAIRAAIEAIRRNPNQPDAIDAPERPGRKELHVKVGLRGFWIGYEVNKIGGETVITIASVEEN